MNPSPKAGSMLVVVSRIFWMLVGPLFLVLSLFLVIERGRGGWRTPDFAFLTLLAALPVARWIEFRGGDARTSTGDPATAAHFRRYTACAVGLGLAAWSIARLVSGAAG